MAVRTIGNSIPSVIFNSHDIVLTNCIWYSQLFFADFWW